MDVKDVVGLVIALVAANWSALAIVLKCRDKIDGSRNLLWGISGGNPPEKAEVIQFIMKSDIVGFLIALVWILCAVGTILIVASYYMLGTKVPWIITGLYVITGFLMLASGIGTGIAGWIDCRKIQKYAMERLQRSQS